MLYQLLKLGIEAQFQEHLYSLLTCVYGTGQLQTI